MEQQQSSTPVYPVALSLLRHGHEYPGGSINVRVPSPDDAERMAASIDREGLLQPLLVVKGPDADAMFYTVIGGRRLSGLRLLQQRGSFPPDAPIPCMITPDTNAAELLGKSLAAEDSHLPPHPVDRYDAFAAMRRMGVEIADIAARHFLEPRAVRQCLALGELHADIRTAWRKGEIGADVAQLFTLADDQKHQVQVLDKLRQKFGGTLKEIGAETVRKQFTGSEAEARRLLAFVGRDAYLQAGGRMTEDLFGGTDAAPSHVVHDMAKLKKVAQLKLDSEAKRLREKDGWSWADTSLTKTDNSAPFVRIPPFLAPVLTLDERADVKDLEKEIQKLTTADGDADAIAAKVEGLEADISRIRSAAALRSYSSAQKEKAGCMVSIDLDGRLLIDHGIVKPEKKEETPPPPTPSPASSSAPPPTPSSPPTPTPTSTAAPTQPPAATPSPTSSPTPPSTSTPPKLSPAVREHVAKVKRDALAGALIFKRHAALAVLAASAGAPDAPIILLTGKKSGRSFAEGFDHFSAMKDADLTAHIIAQFVGDALDLAPCSADDIAALIAAADERQYSKNAADALELKMFFDGCSKDYLLDMIGADLGPDLARQNEGKPQKTLAAFCLDSLAIEGWLPPDLRGPNYRSPKRNGKK